MVKWTKWDVLASLLFMLGITLLLASAGTSDVKSIVFDDPGFASARTLSLLMIMGCVSALAGVALLVRKREKTNSKRRRYAKGKD